MVPSFIVVGDALSMVVAAATKNSTDYIQINETASDCNCITIREDRPPELPETPEMFDGISARNARRLARKSKAPRPTTAARQVR